MIGWSIKIINSWRGLRNPKPRAVDLNELAVRIPDHGNRPRGGRRRFTATPDPPRFYVVSFNSKFQIHGCQSTQAHGHSEPKKGISLH